MLIIVETLYPNCHGHLGILQYLRPIPRPRQGRSALHLASANGALGAVKALLQAHATPVPWPSKALERGKESRSMSRGKPMKS
jgi:hypothetical protein